MKYLIAAGLSLAILHPAAAAQIHVMEPADHSIVKGTVQFRLRTEQDPGEQFFYNPDIIVRDDKGQEVLKFHPTRDLQTGIVEGTLDTKTLKDGLYLVSIVYETLRNQKVVETREEMSLGVRNGKTKPGKIYVKLPDTTPNTDDGADILVTVTDEKGRRMPAAQVHVKVDKGEVGSPDDVTDSHGEATVNLTSDDPQSVTLTITVDDLPPITRVIQFVEKK